MKTAALLFVAATLLPAQSSSIDGTVLHSVSNAPVRKATVTLIAPQFRLTASTDSEGRFQFTALPPGTYKVIASQAGFANRLAPRPFLLGPDAKLTVPPLRLRPQGLLVGRVLDEDGDPIPNARLSLYKRTYQDGRRQWYRLNETPVATETGEFRLAQLAPGAYLLQAFDERQTTNSQYGDRSAQRQFVPTYYPSAATEQAALPIEVGIGTDLRGIEIRLVKTLRPALFRVTGSITGMPPGSEAIVQFSGSSNNARARPPAYTFDIQVPAGEHAILAYESSNPRQAWANGSVTVAGEVSGIVLAMGPPPKVTAVISLTDSDSPISRKGVRVSLKRMPLLLSSPPNSSDDTGKLDFDLPFGPGQYTLVVEPSSLPPDCFVQVVKMDGKDLSTAEVNIIASTHFEIVLSPTAGTITGIVPEFPGAVVALIPADPTLPPNKQITDADGRFKFTNLRPGRYRLYAWDQVDDDLWPDPDFLKRHKSTVVEITVAPRATVKTNLQVAATDDGK